MDRIYVSHRKKGAVFERGVGQVRRFHPVAVDCRELIAKNERLIRGMLGPLRKAKEK